MEVILIRHGQTEGNKEHRFIGGRTDQEVCSEGLERIREKKYPTVDALFVSPMIRCIQTAECIYKNKSFTVIEQFRECDFGMLEGRTHQELEGDFVYQKFLEAEGALPYPEGESIVAFSERVLCGFEQMIEISRKHHLRKIGCVVHGGTIMAVLESVISESNHFYEWYTENGCGYRIEIEERAWSMGRRNGRIIGKI